MRQVHERTEMASSESQPSAATRSPAATSDGRWVASLSDGGLPPEPAGSVLVGAIPGEGIGREVVGAALSVLGAVADASGLRVETRHGGPIGRDGERQFGTALPDPTRDFCGEVFRSGGAVLCGPGGGRFVYDIRRAFDLFFKISPLQVRNGVPDAARIREEWLEGVDILLVRENCGGLYQGTWSAGEETPDAAHHAFGYTESEVTRFLVSAARLARSRSGSLTVVWKESGVPSISALWKRVLEKVASDAGIESSLVDVDLMSYRLVQEPSSFDVIAAPNLFGDVLGDLGAVLLGSRGISYSGNFSAGGEAVYQTNHGAAHELAGTDRANPAGQILSVAMMMRESFGRSGEADAIQLALRRAWTEGWRTDDVAVPGSRRASTTEFAEIVAERAAEAWHRNASPC